MSYLGNVMASLFHNYKLFFPKNLSERMDCGPCHMSSCPIFLYGIGLMHLKLCWSGIRDRNLLWPSSSWCAQIFSIHSIIPSNMLSFLTKHDLSLHGRSVAETLLSELGEFHTIMVTICLLTLNYWSLFFVERFTIWVCFLVMYFFTWIISKACYIKYLKED